jgi:NAD-specific glutamate dehydrogenase
VIEELGATEESIIAAFLAAKEILEKERFVKALSKYDTSNTSKRYMTAELRFNAALDNTTRWILRGGVNGSKFDSIAEIVTKFKGPYHELRKSSHADMSPTEAGRFKEVEDRFVASGFDREISEEIASLTYATAFLDIAHLSEIFGEDKRSISWLYGKVAEDLKITVLLELVNKIDIQEHWDVTAQRTLSSAIRSTTAGLIENIIRISKDPLEERYNQFISKYEKGYKHYLQHLKDIEGRPLSVSAVLVISNQLKGFWQK